MIYNSQMRLIVVFTILLGFHNIAWGMDQIICNSETFRASFSVGSDGYVTYMALQDKSAKYFPDVLEVTDILNDHRHVSVTGKSVDIKAVIGKKNAGKVAILIKHGNGIIRLGARKESIRCDWNI